MADTNNWNKMFTSEDCWRTDNYRVIPHDYGLGTELHKEFCAGIEKCLPGKKSRFLTMSLLPGCLVCLVSRPLDIFVWAVIIKGT